MELQDYKPRIEQNKKAIFIKQGKIINFDSIFKTYNYATDLVNLDIVQEIDINSDNYMQKIVECLEIKELDVDDLIIKTEIFDDEPNYVYQLVYLDIPFKYIKDTKKYNEFAKILLPKDLIIVSNIILFKSYIDSLTDNMSLDNFTKDNLENIIRRKVYNKIVIYDDDWKEHTLSQSIDIYAEEFFGDEDYKKSEIQFLNYYICIWYLSFTGKRDVLGKLIDQPIERCIIFLMKNEKYRGNITLDEVNKIIYLSRVLDDFKTPGEFYAEKRNEAGELIIYNRYRILDILYDRYKEKL